MVSTIVDGIDNGAVEDVFVYRASYSLFRLIQSLGRIRPESWLCNTSHLRHRIWSVKIRWRIWCPTVQIIQPWNSSIEICSIYKVIKTSSFVTINAIDSYYSHTAEYHQTFAKRGRNHAMSDAAIQARAKQDQIESNKEYVHQQLIIMKEKCVVCKRSTCGGNIATCLNRESRHYCYSCHAYSCGDNCHGIAKQDRELVMVNHVCSASWH